MAVTAGDYFRPARSMAGSSIPMIECIETTGQTFKPGEFVTMTSGKILLVTTTDNRFATSATLAWGVTVTTGKASTGTPTWADRAVHDDKVQVVPAVPWIIWEAAVQHSTTASSKIAKTILGGVYSMTRSASNKIWYISLAVTSDPIVTIVGFRDATGTQNGHVYCTLHPTATAIAWQAAS